MLLSDTRRVSMEEDTYTLKSAVMIRSVILSNI